MSIPKRFIYIALFYFFFYGCAKKDEGTTINPKAKLELILNAHSLQPWYPRVIDTINGGYFSNFAYDWTREPLQPKFIVTQARHIWSLSNAYTFHPEKTDYKDFAQHGYQFLKNHMWDVESGGFYQMVDATGTLPADEYAGEKRAYGNAFAIYGLAAYYQISQEQEVLDLAIEAFRWLDLHAHDSGYGGYFQYLDRFGKIIPRSELQQGYNATDKLLVGLKDYNSSIHLMEAFASLYHVWPDDTLRIRLEEMYKIISGTMMDERGFLKMHFYPDWTLVPDQELIDLAGEGNFNTNHISFGHDVETAFLLLEAAEALEIDESEILPLAKKIVDHALANGWDDEKGGFYDQGKYVDGKMKILDHGKNWWAQAEGLNSLLLMSKFFPEDPQNYYGKFEQQLNYIDTYLIDHEHTGWYYSGIDEQPQAQKGQKAQVWKGNYHTTRSLINCLKMLK